MPSLKKREHGTGGEEKPAFNAGARDEESAALTHGAPDKEKTSGMACRRIKTDAGGTLWHAGE